MNLTPSEKQVGPDGQSKQTIRRRKDLYLNFIFIHLYIIYYNIRHQKSAKNFFICFYREDKKKRKNPNRLSMRNFRCKGFFCCCEHPLLSVYRHLERERKREEKRYSHNGRCVCETLQRGVSIVRQLNYCLERAYIMRLKAPTLEIRVCCLLDMTKCPIALNRRSSRLFLLR